MGNAKWGLVGKAGSEKKGTVQGEDQGLTE